MPSADAASVSIAELAGAGIRLRPTEAATLVREIAARVHAGDLPGVPFTHVLRLAPSGAVSVAGPVAAGERSAERAGELLAALLGGEEALSRVSGALAHLVARTRAGAAAPLTSLEDFSHALAPFAAPDAASAIRDLTSRYERDRHGTGSADGVRPAVPSALTISDVRRIRRATGLSLEDISRRSRIPVTLLRQLEWGYLRNWPAGLYGRVQLTRYARAIGLEAAVVVAAAQAAFHDHQDEQHGVPSAPAAAPAPSPSASRVVIVAPAFAPDEPLFADEAPVRDSKPRSRWPAVAAASALLGLSSAGGFYALRERAPAASVTAARAAARRVLPAPAAGRRTPEAAAAEITAPADNGAAPRAGVAPAARSLPAPAPRRLRGATRVSIPWVSSPGAPAATSGAAGPPDVSAPPASLAYTEAGGSPQLRLTRVSDAAGHVSDAAVSPDGRHLAFASLRDGLRGVYVADAEGRHVRLVSGDLPASHPAWAPDGRSVVFSRAETAAGDVWNLWAAPIDGGPPMRLTSRSRGRATDASWFPDGRRLAYAADSALVIVAGGTERAVVANPGRRVSDVAVSPDGAQIAFAVAGDGGWILEVADGAARKVISNPDARGFTWSADGARLAYLDARTGDWSLWVRAAR